MQIVVAVPFGQHFGTVRKKMEFCWLVWYKKQQQKNVVSVMYVYSVHYFNYFSELNTSIIFIAGIY